MLQHYVWFREPTGHQRVIVQVGKTSELASPVPKGSGYPISNELYKASSPFKIEIGPNELEIQRSTKESTIKSS